MNTEEGDEGETSAKAEAGKRESDATSSAMYSSAADDDEDDDVDDGGKEGNEGGKDKNINDAPKSNAESSNSDDSEQDQETVKPANNGKYNFNTMRITPFPTDEFTSDVSDTAVSSRENLLEELSARLAAGEDIVGQALPDSSDSSADCIDDANFLDVDDPQFSTMKRMEQVTYERSRISRRAHAHDLLFSYPSFTPIRMNPHFRSMTMILPTPSRTSSGITASTPWKRSPSRPRPSTSSTRCRPTPGDAAARPPPTSRPILSRRTKLRSVRTHRRQRGRWRLLPLLQQHRQREQAH